MSKSGTEYPNRKYDLPTNFSKLVSAGVKNWWVKRKQAKGVPLYSDLIKQEKDNPQKHFNKTFKCPRCGYCHYEAWVKIKEGEFVDDGRK